MKKIKQQFLFLFVVVLSCFYMQTSTQATVTEGTHGDNISWTYSDETCILTISGNGEIVRDGAYPWETYKSTMKEIVIEEGITSLGVFCFGTGNSLTYKTLEKVTLPSSVATLGDYCFQSCPKLTTINLENVTTMGNQVFYGCSLLNNITLSETITNIPSKCFQNCSSLTQISIPNQITSLGDSCFQGCTSLQTVLFEEQSQLTQISSYCFNGCTSLVNINIPNSIVSLNNYCFQQCDALNNIHIPQSVTKLGNYCFNGCDNLSEISFENPDNITSVGSSCFHSTGLTTFNWFKNVPVIPSYCFTKAKLTTINIPNTVTSIDGNCFQECNFETFAIPNSVTSLGISCFAGCKNLKTITFSENMTSLPNYCFHNCTSLDNIVIPDNFTSLAGNFHTNYGHTFQGCTSLKNITLSKNVTMIPYYFFADCTSLQFEIPDYITQIGGYAFEGNTALTNIILPDSLNKVGEYLFKNCSNLESANIPSDFSSTSSGMFLNCSSLKEITIPKSLKTLKSGTFQGCTSLEKVTFEENGELTTIENSVFSNCSFSSIDLPNSVATINDSVFHNNPNLASFIAPESLTTLGNSCFASCSSLKEVVLTDDITKLGANCFSDCVFLDTINLPQSLTSIGNACFKNTSLVNVIIPQNVTLIDQNAFYNCDQLETIQILGEISAINNATFYSCDKLHAINIPNTVTSIGNTAFKDCQGITEIVMPKTITEVGSEAFRNCDNLISVHLSDNIKILKSQTFRGCDNLENVNIPKNLENIYYECFYSCRKLKDITFPTEVPLTIARDVFTSCDSLENLVIPSNVILADKMIFKDCVGLKTLKVENIGTIPYSTFEGCTSLTDVELSDEITSMGSAVFQNCDSLEQIAIPNGITTLPANLLANCDKLSSVVIPEGVEKIGNMSFGNCPLLSDISLPSSVTTIDKYAFQNCKNILNLNIPSSVTSIGTSAFLAVNHITYENPNAFSSVYGAKQNHNYSEEYTIDVEPTCSLEGSKSQHCIYPRCTATQNSGVVEPCHKYSEWTYDNNNEVVDGYRYATCIYCEAEKTEEYYIYITADEHTSLTVSGNYVPLNETYTTTAVPDVGYEFEGYSGDVEESDTVLTIDTVNKAMSISANSVPKTDTPYIVNHYTKNIETGEYDLYKTESFKGTTDTSVCPEILEITGYELNGEQEDVVVKGDSSTVIDYYYDLKKCTITLVKGDGHIASIALNKITGDGSTYGSTFTINPNFNYGYGLNTITDSLSEEVYEDTEHIYTLTEDITITVSSKSVSDIRSLFDFDENGIRKSYFYQDKNVLIPNLVIYIQDRDYLYILCKEGYDEGALEPDAANTYPKYISYRSSRAGSGSKIIPNAGNLGYEYAPYNIYPLTCFIGGVASRTNPTVYADKTYETFADFQADLARYSSNTTYFNGVYKEMGIATEYKVNHYIEDAETDEYILHKTQTFTDAIGNYINPTALSLNGYSLITTRETVQIKEGTEISYYYDLNEYDVILEKGDEYVTDIQLNILSGNGKTYGSTFTITPSFENGYSLGNITDSISNESHTDIEKIYTLTQDMTITVTSTTDKDIKYVVNHYIQNLNNNEYTLYDTEELKGETNSFVTPNELSIDNYSLVTEKEAVQISPDGSTTISYYYDLVKHTVFFDKDENVTNVTMNYIAGSDFKHGSTFKIIPSFKDGYRLSSIMVDEEEYFDVNTIFVLTKDVEFEIKSTPLTNIPYTVNHYIQNNDNLEEFTLYKTETLQGFTNEEKTISSLEIQGFTPKQLNQTKIILPSGETVFDFYYTRNSYSVSITTTSQGIDKIEGNGTYLYGQTVTISTTVLDGYTFGGYKGYMTSSEETISFEMPSNNVTISVFAIEGTGISYTINHYVMNVDGTYPSTPTKTINYYGVTNDEIVINDYIDKTLEIQNGIIFKNACVDSIETTTTAIKGDGTTTVNMFYDRIKHIITFETENGLQDIDTQTHYYGATVILPSVVEEIGYKFNGWSGDITSQEKNHEFVMSTKDLTILANSECIIYSITYQLNNGSFINSYINQYTIETENFILPKPIRQGYTFKGWTTSQQATPTKDMSIQKGTFGDLEFIANWESIIYTIEYELNGGSLNQNLISYNADMDTFQIDVPIKNGYIFEGWDCYIEEDLIYDNILNLNINPKQTFGNIKLIANWKQGVISIDNVFDVEYTGKPIVFDNLIIKIGDFVLTNDYYETIYDQNTDVGTASITVVLKNGYEGTLTKTFKISLSEGYTFTKDGIDYILEKNTDDDFYLAIKGTSFDKTDKTITTITIPDSICISNVDYPVTSIKTNAFNGCNYITSITLPTSINSIGKGAFNKCLNLKEILSNNPTFVIKEDAFTDCENIVTYPGKSQDNTSNNGDDNKKDDDEIINPSDSIVTVNPTDNEIKEDSSSLIGNIYIINKLKYKIISNDSAEIIGTTNKKSTKIKIPNAITVQGYTYKVTSFSKNAFKNYKKLKTVKIGKNVTTIGKNAFYGCTKLKTVTLGSKVTTISDGAFKKCTSLTKITIPNKVTKIGKEAFSGCKKLKTITIKSKSLKSVGKNAVKGINKKAVIKVPKAKLKTYKKLFKSKTGFKKTMKITK